MTAGAGRGRAREGVLRALRVKAKLMGAEGGPGEVAVDGDGDVLWARAARVHAVNGILDRRGRDAF